jgi:hypothetical protein
VAANGFWTVAPLTAALLALPTWQGALREACPLLYKAILQCCTLVDLICHLTPCMRVCTRKHALTHTKHTTCIVSPHHSVSHKGDHAVVGLNSSMTSAYFQKASASRQQNAVLHEHLACPVCNSMT